MSPEYDGADVSARIRRLERSLLQTRRALAGLSILAAVLVGAAWRAAGEVRAEKLLLTDASSAEILVLRGAVVHGAPVLRLETPEGGEILVLGPGVRPVR